MDNFNKVRDIIKYSILVAIPVFVIINAFTPWPSLKERSLFVLLILAGVFLDSKASRKKSASWIAFDSINLLITVLVFGYTFLYWQPIMLKASSLTPMDLTFAALAIYLGVVATYRVVGRALIIVTLVFALYTFFGQYLPASAGGHTGYSINRILSFMFISENGLLGFIIGMTFKYIILFLLVGKVLQYTGALDLIMDLARVFFRRSRSGPALMAVFASALVGTISGSGTANCLITGNVTIPLMKRVGLKPELAASIEACASTGSQIMPPMLGFAAFFMVATLGVAYFEVMKASFIPALLYFLAVGTAILLRTRELGKSSKGEAWTEEIKLRKVLFRPSTLSFVGTVSILVILLAMRVSLQYSALYAIIFAVVSSWMDKQHRIGPRRAIKVLAECGKDSVGVSVASLIMGLIAGTVLLTGIGGKIPMLFINWAGGNVFLLLVFTMIACTLLGMGLPSSVAYLLVAITVSSALTQVGMNMLHSHMFVFYGAMSAMLTPPVALTSYAAATIARADFWKTGLLAFIIGLPAYLVPFAFMFRPQILMAGTPVSIVLISLLTALGLVCFIASMGMAGKKPLDVGSRVLIGIGGLGLMYLPVGMYLLIPAAIVVVGTLRWIYPRFSRGPVPAGS